MDTLRKVPINKRSMWITLSGVAIIQSVCNWTVSCGTVQWTHDNQLSPIVTLTNGGKVRGLIQDFDDQHRLYLYQGIPYGQAKRFRRSSPARLWHGVRLATKPPPACPQPLSKTNQFKTHEHCLYLNIWQPARMTHNGDRPVMVWIHGGGFAQGGIFQYDARKLAALGDVVVVAIAYRLGSFGFLNLGTDEAPGNQGIYDQILALQWIQKNIVQFGGNPRDVTIFGQSAGGWSVGILVLSPLTTGLFSRAILQSGAPLQPFSIYHRNASLYRSQQFAKEMGCPKESRRKTMLTKHHFSQLDCLRTKSVKRLTNSTLVSDRYLDRVTPYFDSELLPLSPVQASKEFDRDLDLMFGDTRDEGTIMFKNMFPEIELQSTTFDNFRSKIEQLLVNVLKIFQPVTNSSDKEKMNQVIEYYASRVNQNTSKDQLKLTVASVFGNYFLDCPTNLLGQRIATKLAANHQQSGSNAYAYRLMQPICLLPSFVETFPYPLGVSHAQDMFYLFNVTNPDVLVPAPEQSTEFYPLSNVMIETWTQFAKTGTIKPISSVDWNDAIDPTTSSVQYLQLQWNNFTMVKDHWKIVCEQLWQPILDNSWQRLVI